MRELECFVMNPTLRHAALQTIQKNDKNEKARDLFRTRALTYSVWWVV